MTKTTLQNWDAEINERKEQMIVDQEKKEIKSHFFSEKEFDETRHHKISSLRRSTINVEHNGEDYHRHDKNSKSSDENESMAKKIGL